MAVFNARGREGGGLQAGRGGPPLTVEEYSQRFFAKALRGGYGGGALDTASGRRANLEGASKAMYALLGRLEESGEREDVAVPLRVLRDEIGGADRTAVSQEKREDALDLLFGLYDGAVRRAQADIARAGQGPRETARAAGASVILEEIRARFHRLCVGETWQPAPELKHRALEMLWGYYQEELRDGPAGVPSDRAKGKTGKWIQRAVAKTKKDSLPRGHETWEGTFNGLQAAGGNKVFVLLREVMFARQRGDGAGGAGAPRPAPTPAETAGDTGPEAQGSDWGKESAAGGSTAVMGETRGTLNEAALIDLLSLEDPVPVPAPAAASEGAAPPPAAGFVPDFPPVPAPPQPTPSEGGAAPGGQVSRRSTGNPFADEQPAPWAGGAGEVAAGPSGAPESFFADLNPATR